MIECDFCGYKQAGEDELSENNEFRLFFNFDGFDCCEICKREKDKIKR